MDYSATPDMNGSPAPGNVKARIRSTLNGEVVRSGDTSLAAGDAIPTTIGVGLSHEATVEHGQILSVRWEVRQTGSPPLVAGYEANIGFGRVQLVTTASLNKNPLYFVFTSEGFCLVSMYATTTMGSVHTHKLFDVNAPRVASFTSTTRQVYVGPIGANTNYLRFGDPNNQTTPGILIQAAISPSNITVPGRIGILQLVTSQRQATYNNHDQMQWNINGQAVLDGPNDDIPFYQNKLVNLPVGEHAAIDVSGSPAIQLVPPMARVNVGAGNPVVPETYHSYLMFSPIDGYWVPLQVLTWTWQGWAQFSSITNSWGLSQGQKNSINPTGVPTTAFPTWTRSTNGSKWVVGQ